MQNNLQLGASRSREICYLLPSFAPGRFVWDRSSSEVLTDLQMYIHKTLYVHTLGVPRGAVTIFIYIYIHVYESCTNIYILIYLYIRSIYIYTHIYIYTYVNMYIHVCESPNACALM